MVTVLYDEDCGLCRFTVALLLTWDLRGRLLPEPIQSPEGQRLLTDLPPADRLATAHAVTAEGRVASGGDAVAPIARQLPGGAPVALVAAALRGPTRWAYRQVADRRGLLGRLVTRAQRDWATRRIAERRAPVGSTP